MVRKPARRRQLPECYARQVLKHPLPNESGAERLQQVGILFAILGHQKQGEVVTTKRLAALCGMAASQTSRLVKPLMQRGLVRREVIVEPRRRSIDYALRVRKPLEDDCIDDEAEAKSSAASDT